MMPQFSLSANIEEQSGSDNYIATPNARSVAASMFSSYQSGIHSFTIIGSYGTGKSSFLLALEKDLLCAGEAYGFVPPHVFKKTLKCEVLKIVGDYKSMASLLGAKLGVGLSADEALLALRDMYGRVRRKGKCLVIFVDEFGKVLEYAARHTPERELFFMQRMAEYVNAPSHDIMLVTTLHQNFSAYARQLSDVQKEEWTKVKGRFKEIVFVEPVEQLLYLASAQMMEENRPVHIPDSLAGLCQLAKDTRFVSGMFSSQMAAALYPLEPFSAYAMTQAIQRYGQNERSLFLFLKANEATL